LVLVGTEHQPDGTIRYRRRPGNRRAAAKGAVPMILLVSILALIGAVRFRRRAVPAAIGQASRNGSVP
jgi:hypothetical protein